MQNRWLPQNLRVFLDNTEAIWWRNMSYKTFIIQSQLIAFFLSTQIFQFTQKFFLGSQSLPSLKVLFPVAYFVKATYHLQNNAQNYFSFSTRKLLRATLVFMITFHIFFSLMFIPVFTIFCITSTLSYNYTVELKEILHNFTILLVA